MSATATKDQYLKLTKTHGLKWYRSSDKAKRGFCDECGSTLFWRSTQSPDVIAVTLGTLEPPYDGPVERELHTDTKPAWLPVR